MELPPPRPATRFVWAVVPRLVRSVGAVAWRLEIDAGPGFPPPPFVIAANHYSFLDPFLIGAAWRRRVSFIGLHDLYGNYRLVDWGLEAFETIPVRRGVVPVGTVRQALRHLTSGGAVGVFPEGTRHWTFEPEKARPGAAWLAARSGAPLVPVAIAGSEDVLGVDNRLRRGRIRLTVGPTLRAAGTDRPAVDDLTRRWADWVGGALKG